MSELIALEYRVKAKTIYFVTRYCSVGDSELQGASVSEEGEFRDPMAANRAAFALMRNDPVREGIADNDLRLTWPQQIEYDDPKAPAGV